MLLGINIVHAWKFVSDVKGSEMPVVTRRELVVSAAVAGAALGLDGRLAISAPVPVPARTRRPQTPDPVPGFYRFKVGAGECTALYDGICEKPHDQTYFANASVAETKRALAAAKLTTRFVPIPISVFV